MPGKYSHGVVLADYSNRGIINLPPDQHLKYTSSSPLPPSRPSSQARLRGTRSAQSFTHSSRLDDGSWRDSSRERYHPSLVTNPGPRRTRLEVPQEEEVTNFQPMRYSQYYRQLPNSSPNLNTSTSIHDKDAPPVPKLPPETESMTAYQRQQQQQELRNVSMRPNPGQPQSFQFQGSGAHVSGTSRETARGSRDVLGSFRNIRSSASLREAPPITSDTGKYSTQGRTGSSGVSNVREYVELLDERDKVHMSPNSTQLLSSPGISDPPPYDERRQRNGNNGNPVVFQSRHESTQYNETGNDADTLGELGFSSQLGHRTISPELSKRQSHISQSSDRSLTAQDIGAFLMGTEMLGTDIKSNLSGPSQQVAHANGYRQVSPTPVTSSRTNSAREIPSATSRSSTITPSHELRPTSAASSVHTASNITSSRIGKASSPSKHSASFSPSQSQMDRQSWHLPEIKEDQDFNPSIFEARLSYDESDEVDRDDIEKSIGQISSGKDVTFDDTASELSAALPPPISRFRDEEAEFNANMAKLLGEGGDFAITKKGSHTLGKPSKKKGFFAKFRNKT